MLDTTLTYIIKLVAYSSFYLQFLQTCYWCRRGREGQRELRPDSFVFMNVDEATKNHTDGIFDVQSSQKFGRMYHPVTPTWMDYRVWGSIFPKEMSAAKLFFSIRWKKALKSLTTFGLKTNRLAWASTKTWWKTSPRQPHSSRISIPTILSEPAPSHYGLMHRYLPITKWIYQVTATKTAWRQHVRISCPRRVPRLLQALQTHRCRMDCLFLQSHSRCRLFLQQA